MKKTHKNTAFEKPVLNQVEDLTLKLANANKQLKKAEQIRTEMLANISHDLRAPITAIRSSIDYLMTFQEDNLPDPKEYQSLIHLIDCRTTVLETLITDLFYLISLDNKEQAFHFEEIDFIPFLEEYFFSTEADTKYRHRNLVLDIPEDLSANVLIDPNRMTRVMDNLFTNALKYSDEKDSIILHAQCNETEICVCVEDTGIGIPADSIEKIFLRSYTVSSSRTPNTSTGSGLGLSIVKNIILHHNGNVWCESKVNKGSRFYFNIPLV